MLRILFFMFFFTVASPKYWAQCLTIESILVDACTPPSNPYWEGFNEMFRFKVGTQPINASQMQISWANNIPFYGFVQNTQTASYQKMRILNLIRIV
jgi:hypothetical protein